LQASLPAPAWPPFDPSVVEGSVLDYRKGFGWTKLVRA
jgi:hypothetical protein